jgi:hypothetical protein
MPDVNKIDSNISGLRVAKEESYGTLPGTPVWYGLEPNSYSDFGGDIATVARETINDSRSRQQGVTTDVEAKGGFEADLTQTGLAELLEGLFYAIYDKKAERFNNHVADSVITDVSTSTDTYTVTTGTAFADGDLVFASGFTNSGNNGLKTATSGSGALALVVNENLTNETTVAAAAKLVTVGFEFTTGDVTIDVSGDLPTMVSTAKDMTELGIQPGEWIFIGGDDPTEEFYASGDTIVNNGWARVRSVTATVMTFDKTSNTFVTDDGTVDNAGGAGLTVRIWFGRTLANKVGSSIVRTTYQLERTLGANDATQPTQIQSEYIVGAVLNEFTLNLPTADKVTTEMTFQGKDVEQRTGVVGVKAGTRPTLASSEAFNASSDVTRFRLSQVDPSDSFPTALFAFVMEGTLTINNNNSRNQAVGVLGAFDMSAGTFEVAAEVTAYFQNVSALTVVRNNTDVSLDIMMVKQNAGMSIDLPLLTLAGGLAQVELNEPIKLPLTANAAQATPVDETYTHTARVSVYDYLPDAAE